MKTVIRVEPGTTVQGETVLSYLQRNGYSFYAPCGGNGLCGKCTVTVRVNGEKKIVSACRTEVICGMEIELAEVSAVRGERDGKKYLSGENILCVDIGTTTLVFSFLQGGREKETFSLLNPQRTFGQDVMERINASIEHLKELYGFLNREINAVIASCKASYDCDKIKVFVCGNTAMLHIFAHVSPENLGYYPYPPVFLEEKTFSGAELGIDAEEVYLSPSFSSFVGGDIVCGAVACALEKGSLLLDIGTNGETVYFDGENYVCTSCSAGPAFEGAGISCGMGYADGAVNKLYEKDGKILSETVGNKPPVGLCGSGLIDAVAILFRKKIIDKGGTFIGESPYYFSKNVYLTQQDIRKIQLAKSAVRCGLEAMIQRYGMPNKVYLSGNFGTHINLSNAVEIGLLPLGANIVLAGNTALQGAKLCATSKEHLLLARAVARKAKPFYLSEEKNFLENFLRYTDF